MARVVQPTAVRRQRRERLDRPARAGPLLDETLLLVGEREAEGLEQRGERVMERIAEGQPQHKIVPAGEIQLPGEGDIPVHGGVELPVHLVVLGQIGPAVRPTHKAARAPQERDRGREREPDRTLVRHEHLPPVLDRHEPAVSPATPIEMRGEQREQSERFERPGERGDARPDQDTRLMGTRDDLFLDTVALLRIDARDPNSQGAVVDVLRRALQVSPLVVEERPAVGDEILEVADLGAIHGRVIHLVQHAARHREPHAARRGIGGAHGVLRAACPARRDARVPERLACCADNGHLRAHLRPTPLRRDGRSAEQSDVGIGDDADGDS